MARTELWDRRSQRAMPVGLPIVAALLIVARVISARYEVKSPVNLVRWTPAARAERVAAQMHKPILYEFSADWCEPCHVLEEEVFRDPQLAALINDKFLPVKVIDRQREDGANTPEVEKLQSRFGVEAFPTVVVVRPDRQPAKVVGYPGRGAFERFLRGNL